MRENFVKTVNQKSSKISNVFEQQDVTESIDILSS